MKVITKREYQVISLYARGLKFREIGLHLGIATRTAINYYMRVKTKDKGRVTRAKKSRTFNKSDYKATSHTFVRFLESYNKNIENHYTSVYWKRHKPLRNIAKEVQLFRLIYIRESLEFAFKSYNRFKTNLLKKATKREQLIHSFVLQV